MEPFTGLVIVTVPAKAVELNAAKHNTSARALLWEWDLVAASRREFLFLESSCHNLVIGGKKSFFRLKIRCCRPALVFVPE
jgi:hypothetical protein